jgi:hypothetical protein
LSKRLSQGNYSFPRNEKSPPVLAGELCFDVAASVTDAGDSGTSADDLLIGRRHMARRFSADVLPRWLSSFDS